MRPDVVTFGLLNNALQAADLRQQVYANNIANADTPGYKRQDVQFESVLQSEMQTTNPTDVSTNASLLDVQPTVVQDNSTSVSNNGNNVDVNSEMASMAENQIRYNTLIQEMQIRFSRLQEAITGSGS
jgi:flagellar basal-body rod protein FlgB